MARKSENPDMLGQYYWNLTQCEEEILIGNYVGIRETVPLDQRWVRNIEYYFFDCGKSLAFEDLDGLNSALKSHGREPIAFRETEIGEYARSRDQQAKSKRRKQLREEFVKANPQGLAERLAEANTTETRQLPAHFTHEEFKLRKHQQMAAAAFAERDIAVGSFPSCADAPPVVISIGKGMPPKSEKRANFQRLLPERSEKVLQAIQQLKNLSSPNYEYEEAEIEKTFDTIGGRLEEARAAFRRRLTKRSRLTR
jgi:hypothetical protein